MILDFHAHTYPEELAVRVIANAGNSGIGYYADGTEECLRRQMKASGITHSVILNIATRQGQTESVLRYARQLLEAPQDPEAVLLPFASVHPYEPNWREFLHECKAAGFRGIKLHPDYQGFFIDDPKLEPFYREAAALDLMLVFHAGYDVGLPDPVHAPTERILNILPVLELGTTVLAHMGGYAQGEKTLELCGRNLYFDTAYNLAGIPAELAREIIRRHGPERILYGSDTPWVDPGRLIRYFRRMAEGFLSKAQVDGILWNNGASLLGLK